MDRITAEDRYCRFLHAVNAPDSDELRRYVEPAPDLIGLIALENGIPLGAAHGCLLEDGVAELAIVVAHHTRRHGVGRAFVAKLADLLAQRGCRQLVAYALAENYAMANLARSIGMTGAPFDPGVVTWTLEFPRAIAA